tara:strand:- start:2 stop:2632 length:2631 start_codon:yes stop_codon:yes gene_type:complete
MKWIGQNVYDFISRFRNDVYLESVSTGTIASGAHLGLDSNNKIVKAVDGGGDLTSIVAGTGLSGTSLTGPIPTLNVDFPIASANLDADTAHLTGVQTFTGRKIFSADVRFDGDKDVTPGDGAVIHVDTHDVTDVNTSASGTAAKYTHVSIEAPRLAATNGSVTTTNAAALYISGAPFAGTNQTITNNYALWVDDGLVKFDGALTVGGTITGTALQVDNINLDSSTITNSSGDLTIANTVDDGDIIFQSDDGSGGTTAYLTLDGSTKTLEAAVPLNSNSGVTLINATAATSGTPQSGPKFLSRGAAWNSAAGNRTTEAGIQVVTSTNNANPSVSKLSFLVGTDNSAATEQMFVTSGGQFGILGGGDFAGADLSDDNSVLIRNTEAAGSSAPRNSNKLVFEGRFWNSAQGNISNQAYLQLLSTTNNANPVVNRIGFFTQAGTNSGSYTESLSIENSGNVGIGSTSPGTSLQIDSTVPYLTLKNTTVENTANGCESKIIFEDHGNNALGQIEVFHTGTADDEKGSMLLSVNDDSGLQTHITVDGGNQNTRVHKDLYILDDVKLRIGSGTDLEIFHQSSSGNSFIRGDVGDLILEQNTDDGDIIFKCDNGAGGNINYFRLDGSAATHDGSATTATTVLFQDNCKLKLGVGGDLVLFHDSSDSIMTNNTGDLYITNVANDKDIILSSDDGSGGTTAYITLDGSAGTVEVAKEMNLAVSLATDQQKHLMHYQVQGYSAGSTNYVASKNIATNTAPFKHDVDIGSDGTTAKSVTVWMRTGGHVMPNACTLTRFTGWTETAGSASQTLALFRVRLADDSDTDPSAVLLQEVTYTASGNQIANLFNVTSASDGQSLDLAAGDIVFSAIKGAGNPTYFNATFEVEF